MLSALVGRTLGDDDGKACVLAHRDELTAQNRATFERVNPGLATSVVDARQKSWAGRTTFAMVPTLARPANLEAMPTLDLLVIDEAHHAVAESYQRIIDRACQRNPTLKLYGVTATPNRGDRRGLRPLFAHVADQIRVGELIASGHLVRPRTFVIDVGVRPALAEVERKADDFDMEAVDAIMNRSPVTDQVVRHWREKAGDRQTVVFCSTVEHASAVHARFAATGIAAVLVTGRMSEAERRAAIEAYASGRAQVIVNVAVLTEGWDDPPTRCVVLLRPSSYKSTMIQMVGRGLRTVDPTAHPGVVKQDCLILDFGTSSLLHGALEEDADLDGRSEEPGAAPGKTCPGCHAEVPLAVRECPLCGHVFESTTTGVLPLEGFVMTEIDLLKRSSFRWVDLFGDDAALMATGFHGWAGIFFWDGCWYGVGGAKGVPARLVGIGERLVCMAAADDWLNEQETDESAHKCRRWLDQPATDRQLQFLPPHHRCDLGLTRYEASALLSFHFNRKHIQRLVTAAAGEAGARAA